MDYSTNAECEGNGSWACAKCLPSQNITKYHKYIRKCKGWAAPAYMILDCHIWSIASQIFGVFQIRRASISGASPRAANPTAASSAFGWRNADFALAFESQKCDLKGNRLKRLGSHSKSDHRCSPFFPWGAVHRGEQRDIVIVEVGIFVTPQLVQIHGYISLRSDPNSQPVT